MPKRRNALLVTIDTYVRRLIYEEMNKIVQFTGAINCMTPNIGRTSLIYVGLNNGIRIFDLNTMTILDDDDEVRSIDTANVDCMVRLGDSLYTSN